MVTLLNGIDARACVQNGRAKIIERMGKFGLLVECNMTECKFASKYANGKFFCLEWENRESISSLPEKIRKEVLTNFSKSSEGFFANRMETLETKRAFLSSSKSIINQGLL